MTKLILVLCALFLSVPVHAYEGTPSEQLSSFFKDLMTENYSEVLRLYSSLIRIIGKNNNGQAKNRLTVI